MFPVKQTDFVKQTETVNTNSIEEKFFNAHRTSDPTEKALIDFLKRVNAKDSFVEKTAKQIGYPRWDKAISGAHKKGNSNSLQNLNSTDQTFYIPFVRDSQNYVNASMIIHTSQTDTTFLYRCDWEYKQIENDPTSVNDPAEHFATFFMVLDKAVFGYNKFNITDTSLFSTANGHSKFVMLDSSTSSTTNNYMWVEYCQDVVYFYQNCTYQDSNECSAGCDQCYLCMDSFVLTYCWGEYVDSGGGGGGGGTGGGGGGGSTPPPCDQQPVVPFAGQTNVVEPCSGGGGWVPADDGIPPIPYFDYSHLDNPIIVNDAIVQMPVGFNFQFQGFDEVTYPPIKTIGKIAPRGNMEDMDWGYNGDVSGILSNMPNFTDQQLFDEVEELFHKTSTGTLETVGDNMITRFRNNLGGTYSNANLSQKVFENSKFKEFIVKFGVKLNQALENANWNINNVQTIDIDPNDRPVFNGLHNKFNGLQILINDTEETIVELTGFSINAATHKWTANLNIIIKDHFGLDKNDALTYQNNHAGFAAWWILQHCRGYKPFETQVKFKMDLVAE